MTDKSSTAAPPVADAGRTSRPAIDVRQVLRKRALLAEIRAKWGKFDEQELAELKSGEDLAAKVAAKYGLAPDVAQGEVTILLNGRVL